MQQQQQQQQEQHQHQHQHQQQHMYDSPFSQDEVTGSQYTNLNSIQPMSSVAQQIGKLEPFSELLSARYSYYGEMVEQQQQNHLHHQQQQQQQEQQQQQQQHAAYHANGVRMDAERSEAGSSEQQPQLDEDDCDENFGEIIKKSMVETVSA